MTVLGSPIALSSSVHAPSPSSRGLTSPVVGEFKGWFSNLFNWKQSSGQGGILYSCDSVLKTRADVGRLLEGVGIIVEGGGFDRGTSQGDCAGTLKCRVDDSNGSVWSNSNHLKAVRFRLEISIPTKSVVSSSATGSQTQNPYLLTPPTPNPGYLAAPSGGGPGRKGIRNSVLLSGRRSSAMSMSIPFQDGGNGGGELPAGCECVIVMIYERGSVSSFRSVWRMMKEAYGGGSAALPSCSPAMGSSTPLVEHPGDFMRDDIF